MDTSNGFVSNYRAVQTKKLPTRRDIVMENREKHKIQQKIRKMIQDDVFGTEVDDAYDAAEQKWIQEQTAKTAPLRNAIHQTSGGRVTVDDSIYDETELKKILGSIVAMQEYAGGALPEGYTVIADSKKEPTYNDDSRGEAWFSGPKWENRLLPGFKFNLPRDHYGTKNAPYRVYLQDSNDVDWNDFWASRAAKSGWTVENVKDSGETESATHTHELAHTAQYDAIKNTKKPELTLNYNERQKRQQFRDTHPSLQDMFDIAAKNTGFETVRDAAKSISRYAGETADEEAGTGGRNESANWSPNYHRLPEVFAEAYTDVLYNKDNAAPFSKELISLYVDYINDYNRTFNNGITQDIGILPTKDENFVKNWRETYFGKKK